MIAATNLPSEMRSTLVIVLLLALALTAHAVQIKMPDTAALAEEELPWFLKSRENLEQYVEWLNAQIAIASRPRYVFRSLQTTTPRAPYSFSRLLFLPVSDESLQLQSQSQISLSRTGILIHSIASNKRSCFHLMGLLFSIMLLP
ncbi:hypothetical protein Ciccas_013110 [Cichlidogyrus casuarinus]|uniref:Uncharacterized protein n=1 Tax=Cichlidogyrus casuarinus TaxID=1844966 RepID=A0ABD2PLF8_9PLAT